MTNESDPLQLSEVDGLMLVGCFKGQLLLDPSALEMESVSSAFLVGLGGGHVVSMESVKGALASEEIHKVCKFALQNRK